jgi:hypothetical protein
MSKDFWKYILITIIGSLVIFVKRSLVFFIEPLFNKHDVGINHLSVVYYHLFRSTIRLEDLSSETNIASLQ